MGRRKKVDNDLLFENREHIDEKIEPSIDDLLSELGENGRVAVSRIEPDWCKGHVRTISTTADEPITFEFLSQRFGGQKLILRLYDGIATRCRAIRTVEICAPPRNGHGIELVRGPDGEAVEVNQLAACKARYDALHGLSSSPLANLSAQPTPQPQPQPGFDLSHILTALITSQNQQNQVMQTMLVNRIQSLEGALTDRLASGLGNGSVPAPIDPLGSLRSTVDTIAQLEKIKSAMGISEKQVPEESSIYTDLIKSFLELEIEKQRATIKPSRTLPPPPLGLPESSEPEPKTDESSTSKQPTDADILALVQSRLPNIIGRMDRSQRLALASEVLGEQIEESEESDFEDEDDENDIDNDKNSGIIENSKAAETENPPWPTVSK